MRVTLDELLVWLTPLREAEEGLTEPEVHDYQDQQEDPHIEEHLVQHADQVACRGINKVCLPVLLKILRK